MAEYVIPTDLCEDLLLCAVCYEAFSETHTPKALPCLHTFCESCLQNIIHSQRGDGEGGPCILRCPVCKEVCNVPANGVSGFKDDFRIRKISEMISKVQEMSNGLTVIHTDDNQCGVCRSYSRGPLDPGLCVDCNTERGLYCQGCSTKQINRSVICAEKIVKRTMSILNDTVSMLPNSSVWNYKNYWTYATQAALVSHTNRRKTIMERNGISGRPTLREIRTRIPSDYDTVEPEQRSHYWVRGHVAHDIHTRVSPPWRQQSDQQPKCIGRKGTADGEFNFPASVAILLNGDIAVADMHNNRVQIFNPSGQFKNKFGREGFKPCGIAVTREGNIAVTDCKTEVNCIKVFTPDGGCQKQLGFGHFDYPFSIAVDSKERFVVSDPARSRVSILNSNGSIVNKFSTKSKFTFYLTVNYSDDILVSDWYNHCVKVFNVHGHLLREITYRTTSNGGLMMPLGICTDKRGNVFVVDCKNERVSKFACDGRFLRHLIGKNEGLEHSRALALCMDGRLAITRGDSRLNIPNDIRIFQI